jgi:hypothetical protein
LIIKICFKKIHSDVVEFTHKKISTVQKNIHEVNFWCFTKYFDSEQRVNNC